MPDLFQKPIVKICLAISSGVLIFLSFPSNNLFYLEWIAFLPLFFALERTGLQRSYLLGLLTGIVSVFGGFYWIANWAEIVLRIPFPLNQVVSLGYAFCIGQIFGLVAFFFQWLRRQAVFHDIVLFPVILVTVFSFFPMLFYFKMGDGQSYFLPAIQAIEFTGVYGLDFIIALTNIFIFKIIQIPKQEIGKPLLIGCMILLAIWFGYGGFSLQRWDKEIEQWETKNIGIVQPNRPATLSRPKPEKGYSRLFPLEMEMSRRLVEKGADVVFWPEGHLFGFSYWSKVREAFRDHIGRLKTPFVIYDSTYEIIDGQKHYYNTALWFDEKGRLQDKYHKMKLVPFGEYTPFIADIPFLKNLLGDYLNDLSPGREHKTFKVAGMKIVPKICYEPIFPEFVAQSIRDDANGKVILVQSQDGWYGETSQPEQHMAVTALRAVENRVPLVHVINNGSSAIILPNGRYAFRSPAFTRGFWVAKMPYNPNSGGSFYSRHPYLFINLVRGLFCLILVLKISSRYLAISGKKIVGSIDRKF